MTNTNPIGPKITPVGDLTWQALARCAAPDTDKRFFYPPEEGDPDYSEDINQIARATLNRYGKAKWFCARCPVVSDCLKYALDTDDTFGVWGNTTPGERRTIKVRRTVAARKEREAVSA
ncbi:WhiB family transcriptional regulator [Trebonia kvetii]|uniref:Transcriptional regulator WhiB n=1 Tax=Trebonia kvetii TaxID=2480626 RepID=A0A6P2BQ72_9ACTN|nr:WhiB family transcriptional regulator [Trebonia kvetii]TVZ01249.1 WhiB family transcriptional regulator [Trebonia kvetii]